MRPPIAALLTRFCCHRCDDDVNECDQEACGNGGECVNTFGSFYCNCSEGYEGQLCDDLTPGDPGDDTQVAYERRLELDFCRCYRINEKIIEKTPRIVFLCIQLAPNWTWHTQGNWEFWVYSSPLEGLFTNLVSLFPQQINESVVMPKLLFLFEVAMLLNLLCHIPYTETANPINVAHYKKEGTFINPWRTAAELTKSSKLLLQLMYVNFVLCLFVFLFNWVLALEIMYNSIAKTYSSRIALKQKSCELNHSLQIGRP